MQTLLPQDRELKLTLAGHDWSDLAQAVVETREALKAELTPLEQLTTRAKVAGRVWPVTFEDRAREAIEAGDPRPLGPLLSAFQEAVNAIWLKAVWEAFEPAWEKGYARKFLVNMTPTDRDDLFSDMVLEIRRAVVQVSDITEWKPRRYFWSVVMKQLPSYTDFYRAVFNLPKGAKLNEEKIAWIRGRKQHDIQDLDELVSRRPWRG